jgi:hypothetical protein
VNDVDDLDDLERELGPTLRDVLGRVAAEITYARPPISPWASSDDPGSGPAEDRVVMVELESSTGAAAARERRRPRVGVAAVLCAAAVIVVAVVVVLAPLDRDRADDQQAKAVAESFMTAWARGDSTAVAALLAPDGFFDAWTAETLPALDDWYQAIGWQYHEEGCDVMSPDRVWCDYTVDNDLTRAFGRDPVPGSLVLIIDGQTVTSVRDDLTIGAYRNIWTAFSDWVQAHHPEDVDRMYSLAAGYPRVDPASIGLWEQYTGEFIESGAAYIARARAICAAAHEDYDRLVADSAGSEAAEAEAALGVLFETLAELQTLPPPTAVQAPFDLGFSLIQQLIDALHRSITPGPTTPTSPDAPRSPADGNFTDLLTPIAHLQIGLEPCAINPMS